MYTLFGIGVHLKPFFIYLYTYTLIFSEFSQFISLSHFTVRLLIGFAFKFWWNFFFIKSICFSRYVECRFNVVQTDAFYLFLIRKTRIILEVFYKNVKSYQGTRHVDYRYDGSLLIFLCVDFFLLLSIL